MEVNGKFHYRAVLFQDKEQQILSHRRKCGSPSGLGGEKGNNFSVKRNSARSAASLVIRLADKV